MSRLNLAHPASRPADPGQVLISGPPGSGRTETALVVASVLAGGAPVLLIDTDHPRSLDLADRYEFDVVPWGDPNDPAELAATVVEAADEYGAVVIDTITAQWTGKGGTLEVGHAGDWDAARAAQRKLLEAIRSSSAHVVATCDAEVYYQVDAEGHVERVGTVLRHDGDIESRYQVALTLDMAHRLTVTNSPGPALPVGASFGPLGSGTPDTPDFALAYAQWIEMGEQRADADVVEEIRQRIAALPGTPSDRNAVRSMVKRNFTGPRTTDLRRRDVAAVLELIASFEPPEPVVHGPYGPHLAAPEAAT